MAAYLSMEQLAYYAERAGFQGDALRNIVAIAWAESGGQIDALGDSGNSYGLVQVYAPAHPGVDTNRLLTDPAYAFQVAFQISGGGKNFNAWTTWSHTTDAGAKANAQQYLTAANTAVVGVEGAASQGGQIDTTPSTTPTDVKGTAPAGTPQVSQTGNVDTRAGTLTAAGTTTVDELPPNATPDQIERYIQIHYPQAAPFLANPEIRAILLRPDIDTMDETEVEALLRNTDYWRTHGPESRAFDALIGTDSAKAVETIDKAKEIIGDLNARNGIQLSDDQLGEVAKNAIRSGWIDLQGNVSDPAKLNDFLAFEIGASGKPASGEAAASADSLSVIARQYGIAMARPALEDWALKILQGQASEDSFKAYLTGMAKSTWQNDPDMLRALDSGITPDAYFDPYRQTIASTLGLAPDQVDIFNDPRWQKVTQVYDPTLNGGKGGRRTMTLAETAQFARDQPEYANTMAYKQTSAETANNLLQFFGAVK